MAKAGHELINPALEKAGWNMQHFKTGKIHSSKGVGEAGYSLFVNVGNAKLQQAKFEFYEYSFYTNLFDRTYFATKDGKTVEKIHDLSRKELLALLENRVGSKLVEKVGSKLVENQSKIALLILEDEKISKNRVSEILNISDTAVDKNILKLKNL